MDKPGNLPKSNAVSETGLHWIEKHFRPLIFEGLMWILFDALKESRRFESENNRIKYL
jgi:hypothetical protein